MIINNQKMFLFDFLEIKVCRGPPWERLWRSTALLSCGMVPAVSANLLSINVMEKKTEDAEEVPFWLFKQMHMWYKHLSGAFVIANGEDLRLFCLPQCESDSEAEGDLCRVRVTHRKSVC